MNKKEEKLDKFIDIIGKEVFSTLKRIKYPAGTKLINYSSNNYYYYLISGTIFLIHNNHESELIFPYPSMGGEIIGNMYSYNPYAESWEFQVISESEVIRIPKSTFDQLKQNNIKFLNFLLEDSEKKMSAAWAYSFIRIKKGLAGVYAYILVNYSEDNILVIRSITKLCETLDVSRAAFYKVHKLYEECGYIKKIDKNRIKILKKFELMEKYENQVLES